MIKRDWLLYMATFASAFALSILATPWSKKLAFKLGAVDYPKDRGVHENAMPRLGGAAIVFAFVSSLALIYPFIKEQLPTKQVIGFLLAMTIIVIVGLLDDIKDLKAFTKLIFQIIAALIIVYSGIRIELFMWPFTIILQDLSIPITVLWIVGLTNAVNFIDGLDGLAAGVSSIASLCLMVLCMYTGSTLAVVLTAALAGSCLGFLPRNFNPAETFMGDIGSTFLGFVLAVTSILGVFKGYALVAFALSLLVIGLPLFETLFSMIRRALNKQPLMKADKNHFHHKLLEKGFSHKEAVIFLYLVSLLSGLTAILITVRDYKLLIIVFISFIVLLYTVYKYNVNKNNNDKK